ncbi:MAG: DUF58 domain-containing protein [Acidimicrobiales bacterium]|jgi:uncharacterized protein (DUF58 family)|nr:DUF58 domain-containing protein [Acidimicrobiales bacterium]
MERLPVPTRRLALVVVALAVLVAAVGSWGALWAVNGVLLAVVLADWAFAPEPGRVPVARQAPEVLALGARGTFAWRVTNPTGRPLTVAVADELAPSLRAGTRRVRVRVPAAATAEARTDVRPARRGRFEIGDLVVRVEGPLGLAARQRTLRRSHVLRVYPPFRSRNEAELRINKARILEVGLRSAQGRGGGTEFDQLREYGPDDELRRMDWPATARTGKAIVRTYRAERNQTVINLLDMGRIMAGRVDDVPRVEHAMDAVMALTTVATRLGDRAGLVAFDSTVRAVVPPGHSRTQLGRVTEAMYTLEPRLVESDYRAAFAQTMARFRRRAMLVLYTDLVEQAVREMLLPALPMICRNHLVVVASVRDPDVVGWVTQEAPDAEGTYRKAAAVLALQERRRIIARLRGLGATVVDAPPGRLAPMLADAYLKVKATGRL